MRRRLFTWTVLALLLALAAEARSRSLPSKKEAAVLLHDAAEARNLTSQGSPPFHLAAKVHYEIADRSFDGTYELFWASPDRYRKDYKAGTVSDTEVVLGNKLYVLRSTPIPDFLYWRTATLLKSLYVGTSSTAPRVSKVYAAELQGQKVICIRSDVGSREDQDCFQETTTGTTPFSEIEKRSSSYKLELDEFASLGGKFFPRKITEDREDGKLEVEVAELNELGDSTRDIFVPQPAAKVYDRCAKPEIKGKMPYYRGFSSAQGMLLFGDSAGGSDLAGVGDFPYPPLPPTEKAVFVQYFLLIGTDGRAEFAAPMQTQGTLVGTARGKPAQSTVSLPDAEFQQWIGSERFPVRSCGGKPFEYEMTLREPLRVP